MHCFMKTNSSAFCWPIETNESTTRTKSLNMQLCQTSDCHTKHGVSVHKLTSADWSKQQQDHAQVENSLVMIRQFEQESGLAVIWVYKYYSSVQAPKVWFPPNNNSAHGNPHHFQAAHDVTVWRHVLILCRRGNFGEGRTENCGIAEPL